MKIDMFYNLGGFEPLEHESKGIGGTENFITYVAEYLSLAGHQVTLYNQLSQPVRIRQGEVSWSYQPQGSYRPEEERDVLLGFRAPDVFRDYDNAGLKCIALADTESHGLGALVAEGKIDLVMFVGKWQAEKIAGEEVIPPSHYMVTSNGISMRRFDQLRNTIEREPGKCLHISTPERGLEACLDIWPLIEEQVPYATLHLFSSFLGWLGTSGDVNESMCAAPYGRIDEMIARGYRIVNHKHCNAREMREHMLSSTVYLYPTRYFNETCCISALEAAAAGTPIVATARAALKERVVDNATGYLIKEGDEHDRRFADAATALLSGPRIWRHFSQASVEYARHFDYEQIVERWHERWSRELVDRG